MGFGGAVATRAAVLTVITLYSLSARTAQATVVESTWDEEEICGGAMASGNGTVVRWSGMSDRL